MGYQPRKKSPGGAGHGYGKFLHEKVKGRKHLHRRNRGQADEERHGYTEKEISELTLKRLHTLGSQKFGSSPFSQHFDRWLTDVTIVLEEFQSNPNIGVDEEFLNECSQAFSAIKLKLEEIHLREVSLEQELKNLSFCKSRLKNINAEYASTVSLIAGKKNSEVKRLNREIERLKKDQESIIRMKTGFFRGISKKKREQKEIDVAQELNDKQTELEMVVLNFRAEQKKLQEQFEQKKEPVLEETKRFQKTIKNMETDGSLEERWFACEALIDAVNSFLQRKAAQPHESN
jgi:hypothetical protein